MQSLSSLCIIIFIFFTSCVSRHWMGTVGGYQGHHIGPLLCHRYSKGGSGHGMPSRPGFRSDGLWGFWCDLCCHGICLLSSCLWCPVSHLVLLLPSILSISVSKGSVMDGLVTLAATNVVQFLFCLFIFYFTSTTLNIWTYTPEIGSTFSCRCIVQIGNFYSNWVPFTLENFNMYTIVQ